MPSPALRFVCVWWGGGLNLCLKVSQCQGEDLWNLALAKHPMEPCVNWHVVSFTCLWFGNPWQDVRHLSVWARILHIYSESAFVHSSIDGSWKKRATVPGPGSIVILFRWFCSISQRMVPLCLLQHYRRLWFLFGTNDTSPCFFGGGLAFFAFSASGFKCDPTRKWEN